MNEVDLHLGPVDLTVFALYLVGVVTLGLCSARGGARTRRDYFLAGDKLGWWMVGGSIIASNISSQHFVGVMGIAYTRGFVTMDIEWGAILVGFNVLLWIFLPFYLRNGFFTMPEFLQRRFGGAARGLFAVLTLLTYVLVEISAVLYLGALAVNSLLGTPMWASIVVLAAATSVYTVFGGLRAVVWTEMLQLAVLLLGGTALSVAAIRAGGGWSAFMATSSEWRMMLPADDPDFPWTMQIGGGLCIGVFYCAANQFIVQRVLAAKDEWHARMGVVFADYLKFLLPLLIIVPGMVATRLYPDLAKPDLVFPTLVSRLLPTGLVGLVLAGLIAAVMSHLSGAINSCTTILTFDIYQTWINRSATEQQAVRFGRRAAVAVAVAGIFWAQVLTSHADKPVFLYLLNAYGYFTPGIATMFLLGILWKGTTNAGALTAGALTIPMSLALEWAVPSMQFLNRTGIVFWTCMAVCWAASLLTRRRPESEIAHLIWNRASLRLPPGIHERHRGWRNPVWGCAVINIVVLYFYIRYW